MSGVELTLFWSIVALVLGGGILIVVGGRFTRVVDHLADRTGIGEALAGGLLLGATTSLPGLITTGMGALEGRPGFAVSNAMGGIAAQTCFLVIADLIYRRVNLEHAAASLPNLLQAVLLMALLSLVLVGVHSPDVALWRLHPVTLMLVITYLYGLRLARQAHQRPMWRPKATEDTRADVPEQESQARSTLGLWLRFIAMGLLVAAAGWLVATGGLSLMKRTGLSGTFVGALGTSVLTSLPELVTALVAVRVGALTLAVGNIIGGNTFDVMMIVVADALVPGSIYHRIGEGAAFVIAQTLVLTAVLAGGLLHRGRRGIGFEGMTILVLYLAGVIVISTVYR